MDTMQLEQIEELVRSAGAKLMEFWPGGAGRSRPLAQQAKADGSLVTEADFAANEILVSGLNRLFPGDAVVSEELPPPQLVGDQSYWIIDPLDGTKMFAGGRNNFAVLVGRCTAGKVEVGFMYLPAQEILLYGGPEIGAWSKPLGGSPQPISVSASAKIGEHRFCFRFRGQDKPLEFSDSRIDGSVPDSCDMLYLVAVGEVEGLALCNLAEWDLAAPTAILLGAGGTVSDGAGGKILFHGKDQLIPVFVASNTQTHGEALSQLIPIVLNR